MVRAPNPSASLRCVVFHDIAATESPFTKGMGVSVTPKDLEATLSFVTRYYTPVRLQDVLADRHGRNLPPRPILLTFDDGYASIMEWAVPICHRLHVPATLFVNAAFLDNNGLSPDNLICYVANIHGMEAIDAAARVVKGAETPRLNTLADIFACFLPSLSRAQRQVFLNALVNVTKIDERRLAREAGLYLTRSDVEHLATAGFDIGNHTYSHVNCRSLSPDEFGGEIDRNRRELENLSGRSVQSFSVPYGSSKDLTSHLVNHLRVSGHEAVFLSESVANTPRRSPDRLCLDRVSMHPSRHHSLFLEIEILPRLRSIRNRLMRSDPLVPVGESCAFGMKSNRAEFRHSEE